MSHDRSPWHDRDRDGPQRIASTGYQEPTVVWMVEYTDAREPGVRFQSGAFTTEAEAQKLFNQLDASRQFEEVLINIVPVHLTVEDWEWDR